MKHVVEAVKASLETRGFDLSGPCGAFQITKRVAWDLRAQGAGLHKKPHGHNCDGFATDIVVMKKSDTVYEVYDILIDSGGQNDPTFDLKGLINDPANYVPAFDPHDAPPAPTPSPEPPRQPADLTAVFQAIYTLDANLAALLRDVLEQLDRIEAAKKPEPVKFPVYRGRLFGFTLTLTPDA